MTFASSLEKHKPVLDEGAFQQLLAAAYVLQQHNDSLRVKEEKSNSSELLAEVADIQATLRKADLDEAAAAQVIADRLLSLIGATGVSVSLILDGFLDCVAESGTPANVAGSSLASHSLIATERLKNGEAFDSSDAQSDIRLDVGLCRENSVGSLIANPIQRFGEIAGLVEARWDHSRIVSESDKRTCDLMAGLATQALERRAQREKQAVDVSPIFPELAAAGGNGAKAAGGLQAGHKKEEGNGKKPRVPDSSTLTEFCRVCGTAFAGQEAFCGQCSMPRVASAPPEGLQSKWASMWYMQKAQNARRQAGSSVGQAKFAWPAAEAQIQTIAKPPVDAVPQPPIQRVPPPPVRPQAPIRPPSAAPVRPLPQPVQPAAEPPPPPAVRLPVQPVPEAPPKAAETPVRPQAQPPAKDIGEWSVANAAIATPPPAVPAEAEVRLSPAVTHDASQYHPSAFRLGAALADDSAAEPVLEKRSERRLFHFNARDMALLAGSVLVVMVLAAWALSSTRGAGQLTWFEALLVKIGVAEVPSQTPAVYTGRPDARVWEDAHTSLYYCEGSNMYGKTPAGQFVSQHRAQKDHFESATGVSCP